MRVQDVGLNGEYGSLKLIDFAACCNYINKDLIGLGMHKLSSAYLPPELTPTPILPHQQQQIDEEIEGSKQVGNRPEPIKGPPQAPSTT